MCIRDRIERTVAVGNMRDVGEVNHTRIGSALQKSAHNGEPPQPRIENPDPDSGHEPLMTERRSGSTGRVRSRWPPSDSSSPSSATILTFFVPG